MKMKLKTHNYNGRLQSTAGDLTCGNCNDTIKSWVRQKLVSMRCYPCQNNVLGFAERGTRLKICPYQEVVEPEVTYDSQASKTENTLAIKRREQLILYCKGHSCQSHGDKACVFFKGRDGKTCAVEKPYTWFLGEEGKGEV